MPTRVKRVGQRVGKNSEKKKSDKNVEEHGTRGAKNLGESGAMVATSTQGQRRKMNNEESIFLDRFFNRSSMYLFMLTFLSKGFAVPVAQCLWVMFLTANRSQWSFTGGTLTNFSLSAGHCPMFDAHCSPQKCPVISLHGSVPVHFS